MHVKLCVTIALLAASACNSGDKHQLTRDPRAGARLQKRCAEHMPRESTGPRPTGTRDDPFIGHGVVFAVHDVSPGLVRVGIRHQPIPYFKIAAEMAVNVPRAVAARISPGDFIQLKYARLPEDSPLRELYESGIRPEAPLQYVYCGYEIFTMDVAPHLDAEPR